MQVCSLPRFFVHEVSVSQVWYFPRFAVPGLSLFGALFAAFFSFRDLLLFMFVVSEDCRSIWFVDPQVSRVNSIQIFRY